MSNKPYGYNCPICGEPITEPQDTEHTEDGLSHASCCSELATPPGYAPFTTDGCSDGGLSKLFGIARQDIPDTLHGLCVEHDKAYWLGGTAKQRLIADIKFRDAITAAGHPVIAAIYYRSVRAGGVGWIPTTWRWGYGKLKRRNERK